MTITDIKLKLETASNPVAKPLHTGVGFKCLLIGFKKGMILKEHKTSIPSKLTVLEGAVIFKEADRTVKLNLYDEMLIPLDVLHHVEATQDSICILTQGA